MTWLDAIVVALIRRVAQPHRPPAPEPAWRRVLARRRTVAIEVVEARLPAPRTTVHLG